MKILIYGINFSPELTGIGKYTGEMSAFLAANHHEVRVVTAPPYYPEWKIHNKYSGLRYTSEVVDGAKVYRVPIYVPKKLSFISRVLHLMSFSLSSLPIVLAQIKWKPDVIVYIQPTLFASLGAVMVSKICGAKSIMHVQDYEIDAMLGLSMIKERLALKVVKRIEKILMSQFDLVSSISYSMLKNAKSKGVSEANLFLFPNWSDIDYVTPYTNGDSLKSEWGFQNSDKIVLYAGNIGKKQGLELLIEAAEILKDQKSLKFLIVGTGAHVESLKKYTSLKKLCNVYFKPLQPWRLVPEMLAMANVHMVIQKRGAADVVLPSKLTNILSCGGYAIVTAEEETELGMLASRFPGIYERVEPENSVLLVESLKRLLNSDLSMPNRVARDYAVRHLAKDSVLADFEQKLQSFECNE